MEPQTGGEQMEAAGMCCDQLVGTNGVDGSLAVASLGQLVHKIAGEPRRRTFESLGHHQ